MDYNERFQEAVASESWIKTPTHKSASVDNHGLLWFHRLVQHAPEYSALASEDSGSSSGVMNGLLYFKNPGENSIIVRREGPGIPNSYHMFETWNEAWAFLFGPRSPYKPFRSWLSKQTDYEAVLTNPSSIPSFHEVMVGPRKPVFDFDMSADEIRNLREMEKLMAKEHARTQSKYMQTDFIPSDDFRHQAPPTDPEIPEEDHINIGRHGGTPLLDVAKFGNNTEGDIDEEEDFVFPTDWVWSGMQILDGVLQSIIGVFRTEYEIEVAEEDIYVYRSFRPNKFSAHIVVDKLYFVHPRDLVYFSERVKGYYLKHVATNTAIACINSGDLWKKFLDPNIFKINACLRLYGCAKKQAEKTSVVKIGVKETAGALGPCYDRGLSLAAWTALAEKQLPPEEECRFIFEKSLATNISDCIPIPGKIIEATAPHNDSGHFDNGAGSLPDEYIRNIVNIFLSYLPEAFDGAKGVFRVRSYDANYKCVVLDRIRKDVICPIHGMTHDDNAQLFIKIRNGTLLLVLKCMRRDELWPVFSSDINFQSTIHLHPEDRKYDVLEMQRKMRQTLSEMGLTDEFGLLKPAQPDAAYPVSVMDKRFDPDDEKLLEKDFRGMFSSSLYREIRPRDDDDNSNAGQSSVFHSKSKAPKKSSVAVREVIDGVEGDNLDSDDSDDDFSDSLSDDDNNSCSSLSDDEDRSSVRLENEAEIRYEGDEYSDDSDVMMDDDISESDSEPEESPFLFQVEQKESKSSAAKRTYRVMDDDTDESSDESDSSAASPKPCRDEEPLPNSKKMSPPKKKIASKTPPKGVPSLTSFFALKK